MRKSRKIKLKIKFNLKLYEAKTLRNLYLYFLYTK